MAVIKKSDLKKLTPEERQKKIVELRRAMLELRGEGRKDKTKVLRKTIARLMTPAAQSRPAKQPTGSGSGGAAVRSSSMKKN